MDMQEWQEEGIKKAILSLNRGKRIQGDIAMKWFNSLGLEKELPMPTAL